MNKVMAGGSPPNLLNLPRYRAIIEAMAKGCKMRKEMECATGYTAGQCTSALGYLQRGGFVRILHRNTKKGAGVYALAMPKEKALEQLRDPAEKVHDFTGLMEVFPIGRPVYGVGRVVLKMSAEDPKVGRPKEYGGVAMMGEQ